MPHLKRPRFASQVGAAVAVAAFAATGITASPAAAQAGNRFEQVNLVSNQPGVAQLQDPSLVNAWGIAEGATTPIWVSNNGSDNSTLYRGAQAGTPVAKVPLTVNIPGGEPTGVVRNDTASFKLSRGGRVDPALFIFASESGNITAWNQDGNTSTADIVASSPGAVYKGLAMVTNRFGSFLLATDFHHNRVDMFDSRFHRIPFLSSFLFRGLTIPHGFAPFGIASLGNRVYVSYAKQDADRHDDVAGLGNGFINVFDKHGIFLGPFARRGLLNSPWGMAIAPTGFGPFAGKLLVGNFGDGRVHVFDRTTRRMVATVRDTHGMPITIDGLWGLLPGNGVAAGTSDVWFSAGPNGESNGLLGVLRAAS